MKRWMIFAVSAALIGVALLASWLLFPIYSSPPKNPCLGPSSSGILSERLMDIADSTPQERFDGAELVVVGRITDATARCDGPQIMTYMQIVIEESLKNPENLKTLTARTFGGKIGDYGVWVEDSPIFHQGDRAFLYLSKERSNDSFYLISPYSGPLVKNDAPDDSVSGREILETFRLQSAISAHGSTIAIQRGTASEATLMLQSFFGYDSPTNLTISSFAKYSDQGVFNTGNLTVLDDFGISIEPASVVITPRGNGTSVATFSIEASEQAVEGVYDIFVSSMVDDRYSHLAGGVGQTFLTINITDDANSILTVETDGKSYSFDSPVTIKGAIESEYVVRGKDEVEFKVINQHNIALLQGDIGLNEDHSFLQQFSIPSGQPEGYYRVIVSYNGLSAEDTFSVANVFVPILTFEPAILDIYNNVRVDYETDQQLVVEAITKEQEYPFRNYFVMIEIRNMADNSTSLFAWQSSTPLPDGDQITRILWTPKEPGRYQIKTIVQSSLLNPVILSAPAASEVSVYAPSDEFKGIIKMKRGLCDGDCPGYTVEVDGAGRVVFEGYDFVAKPGRHHYSISKDSLRSLVDEFHKADFFALADSYPFYSEGAPGMHITFNMNGRVKEVRHQYEGGVPDKLLELEKILDEILGTEKWVYGREE
jgi:hypothetical protein